MSNFQALEVVGRGSKTQLQEDKNLKGIRVKHGKNCQLLFTCLAIQ